MFYPDTTTDMAQEYDFLMKKNKDGSEVVSSLLDFGFAVSEIPWPDDTVKELATRQWPGEDGEDVYIPPSGLKLEAFDLEVKFCFKGLINKACIAHEALRDYLTGADGDGVEMSVFDPYWGIGRTKVRLLKIIDRSQHRTTVDEELSMTVVFRVADPKTGCVLYLSDEPRNKFRLETNGDGYILLEN